MQLKTLREQTRRQETYHRLCISCDRVSDLYFVLFQILIYINLTTMMQQELVFIFVIL